MANPHPKRPTRSRKGSPNRVTASIKQAFKEAFDQRGGVSALLTWADENPTAFYQVVGRLIPTEVNGSMEHVVLTMAERKARIAQLLKDAGGE